MLPGIGTIRPWADPTITGIGRRPMHVPLERADTVLLDGAWTFARFAHPDDVPADALTGPAPARTVAVPGNWTLQGTEDLPHYTNVQMPFPQTPPDLPDQVPTGVHRRTITAADLGDVAGRRVFLRVEGAESVHAVHVDGTFVGYGTDSRLPSEYELTAHVADGADHEVALTVLRYSAHSYVEDQDQWWMAGLHRSVVLETRPAVHLHDIVCDTDLDPATGTGTLTVTCDVDPHTGIGAGWTTRVQVLDPDGAPVGGPLDAPVPHLAHHPNVFDGHRSRHRLTLPDARPWSAETPDRYRVDVMLVDPDGTTVDMVSTRCGLRRVEVRDRRLLVNGRAVWIFGVNRHEHHPDRGKAITVEDMRADLVTMRAHNITAVRTAHYPNHPAFYDLCDELGLYVVDEANIEGHAFNTSICRDERYRATFLERGARMVQRDRNHPSVILWSLGNETGYGPNHDALAGWIRRVDPSRPLHYEGAVHHGDHHDPTGPVPLDAGTANTDPVFDPADANPNWIAGGLHASDVVCPMYPPLEAIRKYGADGLGERPLILCEYSHAMGNSNGSLADHWDVITTTPGLQGGFIWEWKDHALRDATSGRLLHGGDLPTEPNDGNFIADGLVGADGDPHPGLAEVAWVYRPVTTDIVLATDSAVTLSVTNRRSFVDLDDLAAEAVLLADGHEVARATLTVPDVPPGAQVALPLPDACATALAAARTDADVNGVETVVQVVWRLREPTWYAPTGHAIAWDGARLTDRTGPVPAPLPAPADADALAPVLLAGPEPTLLRAATDNDGFKLLPDLRGSMTIGGRALDRWLAAGLNTTPATELATWETTAEPHDGGMLHRVHVTLPEPLADVGRVGMRLALPRRFTRLRWYGRGPGENYPDRRRGSLLGVWEGEPDPLPYLVPQEYGLRCDVRWLACTDPTTGETVWLRAMGPDALHVGVTAHTAEELLAAASPANLPPSDRWWVHVDVAHRGLGTGSCGPRVAPQYRIPAGEHTFAFWLGVTPTP